MDIVTCRLCGEKIKQRSTFALGSHLMKKHHFIGVSHFSCHDHGDEITQTGTESCTCVAVTNSSSSSLRLYKTDTNSRKKENIHKTTVESWQPSTAEVLCPYCCRCGKPYIRKQRNKIAYTSVGTFCLLTFWPLCFLPFVMSGSENTSIYCKHCGHLLGIYDRRKGKVLSPKKSECVDVPTLITSQ